MDELNIKLKELRMKNEFSQEEVANTLFISRQAVSNWETGKNYPDLTSIVLLSKMYNVSLDELLKGERKVVKLMQKELVKINSSNLVGSVFISILAFIVPVVGIGFSVYLLNKSKQDDFPSWAKIIAILSIISQTLMILWIIITVFVFGYTDIEQMDEIKNSVINP